MATTTTQIAFSAIDYKGVNSLSSYALPITPLRFIPDASDVVSTRFLWDFGDGTIAKSFSAEKAYQFPGLYTVTLVHYNCDNLAEISTITKTIQIYDYIPLTFSVDAYDGVTPVVDLDWQIGQIEGPLKINFSFPWYQPQLDIFYDIYNSESNNYWEIYNNKFSHLDTFNVVYEKVFNFALSSYQYSEIQKITPETQPIYLKKRGSNIVRCLSSDTGSCFGGLTAIKNIYVKEDSISEQLLIDLNYDKANYKNPYIENFDYLNNLGITLSATVGDNPPTYLSVTSNGLDGEGFPVDSFHIHPIKFYGAKIPFVVKAKDAFNFSVKNFGPIPLSALGITVNTINDFELTTEGGIFLLDEFGNQILADGIPVTLPLSAYSISSLNYTLSGQDNGGSFRGYVIFNNDVIPNFNVQLTITATLTSDQSVVYDLEGESNFFNVYPENYFDIYKKNEDFDASEQLKDLRFQEILIDKNILFDDFFGGALGGINHEDVGTKTYEGAANFVANTQDLDVCNIVALNSLGEFMGYNDVYEERYLYPVKVKRLIDLLSIDRVKLFGYENKFVENFDVKGRTAKDEFGINIGNKLDTNTYIVSSTVPIVALEKFSNSYTLLNTYQPISAVGAHEYPLSAYSSDWGWPLVLPTAFDFAEIEKYYLFFDFVDVYDGTMMDGVVDFNNPLTTIPSDLSTVELNEFNGIKEHMFLDTLYHNLSIIQ